MQVKLIIDPALTGEENMARDENLLAAGIAALRFYQWSPACVSIGYFQDPGQDIDMDFLSREGIGLVRRSTGGRAVLHDQELTYSVILPEDMLPAGIIPSYKKIAQPLVHALTGIGIPAQITGPEGRGGRTGVCFAEHNAYEISVAGKKVIGSAQVRRNGFVLQHGSILLSVDYEKHSRCMKGKSFIPPEILASKMAGLEGILGEKIQVKRLTDLISRAFEKVFETRLVS